MFISKCCGCLTQDQILESVAVCEKHNTQFGYVCLNKQGTCPMDPLLCPFCLEDHKGHQFMSINTYFTPQFRYILKTGTSLNGHAVARLTDHVTSDIQKMRAKLNREIDRLQQTTIKQIRKFKPKYPLRDKFGIPGTEVNKNNIVMLMDIVERQKNHIWVPATQKYMRSLIGQVTAMLANLYNDLDTDIANNQYEQFTERQSQRRIQNFVQRYQGKYDPDRTHFLFSLHEKHENIRIFENGVIAKFIDTNPSKPAVLSDAPFDEKNDTFYVKITKLDKTALVFDSSVVFVGVSILNTASIFGFRNLIQPSRGTFLIGSNGKCYHSSLQKYNKQSLSFGFGQGDTIAVNVDFKKKMVNFSKWGFFQRKFSMQLDIKDDEVKKLRACVLFHGQKGALVQIVDQDVFRHKQQQQKYEV